MAANLQVVGDFVQGLRQWYFRRVLFAELRPVPLANCAMERFGNGHDGGYLMCENLLTAIDGAYSYGIEGRDEWGCAIAGKVDVPVHQYDCFVTTRPACQQGRFVFHEECVGDTAVDSAGRVFESLANQVIRNGDAGKRLVIKMDVEGAEWAALAKVPDDMLAAIDQLVVEFHGVGEAHHVDTLVKLKRTFVVANVHFNNVTCAPGAAPLPAHVYEVLFVNRSLASLDRRGTGPRRANSLDRPNNPRLPDCQAVW